VDLFVGRLTPYQQWRKNLHCIFAVAGVVGIAIVGMAYKHYLALFIRQKSLKKSLTLIFRRCWCCWHRHCWYGVSLPTKFCFYNL
jgi:hypothetical protein